MSRPSFVTENGLIFCEELLKAEALVHCFTTRKGGISALAHTESMNLGFGRGDPDAVVEKNISILREKLGLASTDRLVCAAQVHSDRVVYADGSASLYDAVDGFVTDRPGVFLLVKIADCQPILFFDPVRRIAGACHAGWRGTAAGIAAETVKMMVSLGAEPSSLIAACGPCIGSCCFEVGEDFVGALKAASPELLSFVFREKRGDDSKIFADLRRMNRHVLLGAGLEPENIFVSGECTCCDAEKFFSHRRTHGLRGTMAAVIGMKNV